MSQRSKLFERYRKSDIFNLTSTDLNQTQKITHIPYLNTFDSSNPITGKGKAEISEKKLMNNPKKYVSKHHQSDIFNLNKNFQTEKSSKTQRKRIIPNKSTCFDGMKNNEQYVNDIKEYTKRNRAEKIKYDPLKYFNNYSAHQRLYSQLNGQNRNIITGFYPKNNNIMKSSANLFSNMKIDVNNFNNTSDKIKIRDELENTTFNTHKYYKTKGFTYIDNEGFSGNVNNNVKFVSNENNINNNINNTKINKQLQLQSNIFNDENLQKNENDINKIKQRIISAENSDESKPKKYFFIGNNNNINIEEQKEVKNESNKNFEDRNIWGALHNNWEKSNLNWMDEKTEILFNKTNINNENKKDNNLTPFERKMNQLSDSNHKDTINETIKLNRKYNNNINKQRFITNLEQIDEILNDVPALKYDKKQKILENANTTGLNGDSNVDKNILNYTKFHKVNISKKNKKEPTIKIMSKESQNHFDNKKKEEKICNNLKKYDNYNIHDYILSYDAREGVGKNEKNNFDKLSENDVKILFSKNGIHIYDIKKNMFHNGKYNVIKFKVRENEGEQVLSEKMKEIENIFNKKEYKISIKKEGDKNLKKNLRNVAKAPWAKTTIFIDDVDKKNNLKQYEKNKNKNIKKNSAFSSQCGIVNTNYKNHYKELEQKNKVNK